MKLRRILGVFFRYLYTMNKGLMQLSDIFYWPLVDILLWGLTSFWIQTNHSSVHNLPLIMMTGLVFWQICWRGSVDISVNLLQEFWQRNLVNFFSTPLKFCEWVTGMILLSMLKLCGSIAFCSLVVYILYALNVFTIGWCFLPFTVSLIIFGWSLGFLASSMIVYWGHKVEFFAWMIGGLFMPFSAVFYPASALPLWGQKVAWCLPTTYIFEGMRSILYTGIFPTHFFWISLALDLVFLSAAISLFRFMFLKSRRKGLARLE